MRGGAFLQAAIMIHSGSWTVAGPWIPAMFLAVLAGVLDWRYRRIPNWLTVSAALAGIAINTFLSRWPGLKSALLGMVIGLALLLPFVLLRAIGKGDWKMVGALGACLGPQQLISALMVGVLVAGVIALIAVIATGRLKQALVNIVHMLGALFTLRMPGREVSLDDPNSTKIPFGVAMALAILLYGVGRATGRVQ